MSMSSKRKKRGPPRDGLPNGLPNGHVNEAMSPAIKRKKLNKSDAKHRLRIVDVDALPWRQVDDDGFGGLEVLEDVQLVRNGDQVEYLLPGSSLDEECPNEQRQEEEYEEFNGFPDSDVSEEALVEETRAVNDSGNHSKPASRDAIAKKRKVATEDGGELYELSSDPRAGTHNSFETLATVPDPEPNTDTSAWAPLNLSPGILTSIARLNFSAPTPIQSNAIPHIRAGRDVIGKASTGSGKTLAFAIPIVERWLEMHGEDSDADVGADVDADAEDYRTGTNAGEAGHTPIALILSPTRELAHQITKHILGLCAGLPRAPRVATVTGGLSVHKQQRQLETADVAVGTPGRLWEVLDGNGALLASFQKAGFLVLDEADRLLADGHFKEVEEILSALDKQVFTEEHDDEHVVATTTRQTLIFSATFNKGLQQKLAGKGRYDLMSKAQSMEYLLKRLKFRDAQPKFIDVNPSSQLADGLQEGIVECRALEKDLYIYAVLLLIPSKRTLIFTNSIHAVRRLTPMLGLLGLHAHPLHSQMLQKARLRSVERFSSANNSKKDPKTSGSPSILVATDVAARGLDIPDVDAVIHYHVPRTADAYVHRSGRTARGDRTGLSIMLCAPEEVTPTRRLAAKVHVASASKKEGKQGNYMMHTMDVDRAVASRLRERVDLAKRIADAELAKERGHKEDDWMKAAAEELGLDDDDMDEVGLGKTGWGGRGSGRKRKEVEAKATTKAELGMLKSKLKEALSRRVNTGVSERYIAGGSVDVKQLLLQQGNRTGYTIGELAFLGKVDGLVV